MAAVTCRYASQPLHQCARRDGRPLLPGEECHAEAAAQLNDLIHLQAEVDSAVPLSWLLSNRSAWEVS